MAGRSLMVSLGLLVLGIVILAIGGLIEPARTAANPVSEAGESLIAIGLTFIVIAIGFFLAWGAPTD